MFSLILNIGNTFQFKISCFNIISNPQYIYKLDSYSYPSIINNISFSVYSFLYFVVNFILFLVFNTTVAVILVRKVQKELSDKRKRLEQINQIVNMRTRRKLEMDSKKDLRAIVMVIANSLVNFFLRLPEILIFISSTAYDFKTHIKYNFTYYVQPEVKKVESFLVDVAYLTFICTFSTNVAMFYLFNTKFKQSFKLWSNVKEK